MMASLSPEQAGTRIPKRNTPLGANRRLRIVVLGYFVRGPLGGMVWSNLQYLMGLAHLGHDVFFFEDSDDYPSCYDPEKDICETDPSYGLRFASTTFERVGLGARWAYHDAHTSRWLGPCADRVHEVCGTADMLLNLCGMNPMRPWWAKIPVRVFLDEDPAFTQIRHLTDPAARRLAEQHTVFLSFGANVGSATSLIPDDGFPWKPTRQPVVLDGLDVTPGPVDGKFTTVMIWESYPAREFRGVRYGMKADSFLPFLDLPQKLGPIFELGAGGPSVPKALLRSHGWLWRDPREPTLDPWTYQDFIRRSKAEFSVAKHGYVTSHSGWFSERSLCYMACGRPVLIQDTGFSDWLPTGSGVITFNNPDEVLTGVDEINARYEHHCNAARVLAEEYFRADTVLEELLKEVGM
jgi:hypothetical protein